MYQRRRNLPQETKNYIILAVIFVFATFIAPISIWWQQKALPFAKVWQRQHNGGSFSIAFSPDGKFLASAGADIKLWQVNDGQLVQTLKTQGWAYSVAFSHDGKYLASGGTQINIWRLSDNRLVRSMVTSQGRKGIQEQVNSIAFSPNGEILASGGWEESSGGRILNGVIKIWQVADGKLVRAFKVPLNHSDPSVVFSPNGEILAAGNDNIVYLWRISNGRLIQTINVRGTINQIAFSPDGKILVTVSHNIQLWQVADGRLVRTLKGGNEDYENCVAFSPNGKFLVSGGYSSSVIIVCNLTYCRKITKPKPVFATM